MNKAPKQTRKGAPKVKPALRHLEQRSRTVAGETAAVRALEATDALVTSRRSFDHFTQDYVPRHRPGINDRANAMRHAWRSGIQAAAARAVARHETSHALAAIAFGGIVGRVTVSAPNPLAMVATPDPLDGAPNLAGRIGMDLAHLIIRIPKRL